MIRTALKQNYDARIAATRVLEAQAQVGITRADQFPTVNAVGNGTNQRNPAIGPFPSYGYTIGRIGASAAWDLDFWGKYRRATEAARADLLASEWARQEVNATLVANVAAAYFQLRELDLELEISKRALASRKESLELTKTLEEHGINSILDVRQAEQLGLHRGGGHCRSRTAHRAAGRSAEHSRSEIIPGPSRRAARNSSISRTPRRFRPGFPPRCWSAARTFASPSSS